MNRERCKELLPIFEAFANGEDVEFRVPDDNVCGSDKWSSIPSTGMSLASHVEYRIKPKPREFWIISTNNRGNYPHVLSLEEKEKHFADSMRYIKVREVQDEDRNE